MNIQVAAQWAPVIGLFVSALAVGFAGVQMRQARKTAVLQVLQEFFKQVTERERALRSATDEVEHRWAFVEYLNFLELYAAVCNRRVVRSVAKEMIRDKLIDSIAVIERTPEIHVEIEMAVTTAPTFKHLRRFYRANRNEIKSRPTLLDAARG
jgi:hypothetical protein